MSGSHPDPSTMLRKLTAPFSRGLIPIASCITSASTPVCGPPLSLSGWEAPDCELRGHFVGHFLSASALMYSSTGDTAVRDKANYMVAELAKCQSKLGGGYLSAFPLEFFDRLYKREKVWAPFYTIHKIMAGMLDMHQHCSNQQALTVLEGMADWVDHWTAPIPEPHMQSILDTEYGGMNEVLYNLAALTGDDRYAQVGDRFTKKNFSILSHCDAMSCADFT